MNLKQMIFHARLQLQDLGCKRVLGASLARSANEGKNELAKAIRQAREDYFYSTTTGVIAAVAKPNPSTIVLPSDFAELKELMITDAGYEHISFQLADRSRLPFKQSLIDGGLITGGTSEYFYDIVGNSTMLIAPGFDVARNYEMNYISTVADMVVPTDAPNLIPAEHHDWIVTWMVCEALRSLADPRFQVYKEKLEEQYQNITNSVNARQVREPQFVVGFGEDEGW